MNSQSTLNLLHSRRSVKAVDMAEPGPSAHQIDDLLKAAHRVPDHGKIGPWRFVVFTDSARASFDAALQTIYSKNNPDAKEKLVAHQGNLLSRAPCVVAVIASPDTQHAKVPIWEQTLSAGAVCQNLILAAHAMGFAAQWLTEWYSYDAEVHELLTMGIDERIAGFVYIGSVNEPPQERARPSLDERITYWSANACATGTAE